MIRLESLAVRRFRGIKAGEISDLVDVNVLVGRNNSGKTTIVEAISRLGARLWATEVQLRRAPFWPPDREEQWKSVRNEAKESLPTELWYQSNQAEPIYIGAVVRDTESAAAVRQELRIDAAGAGGNYVSAARPQVATEAAPAETSNKDNLLTFLASAAVFRPEQGRDPRMDGVWTRLLERRRDKVIVESLRDIFRTDIESISMVGEGRLMLLFPEFGTSLDVQGDGARAALRCMMAMSVFDDALFLIEEPESFQHPGALERFSKALCCQAKRQRVQMILTTHSAEAVKGFLRGADQAQLESAVFHLRLSEGELQARRLSDETVSSLDARGVDVRSLDLYE